MNRFQLCNYILHSLNLQTKIIILLFRFLQFLVLFLEVLRLLYEALEHFNKMNKKFLHLFLLKIIQVEPLIKVYAPDVGNKFVKLFWIVFKRHINLFQFTYWFGVFTLIYLLFRDLLVYQNIPEPSVFHY